MSPPRQRLFISYRHLDREWADRLANELSGHGYRLWTDWTSKVPFWRRRAVRRDDSTETGLDTWLRSGALRSDVLLGIIPQSHFMTAFLNFREGDDRVPFVELMVRERAPGKLYRDAGTFYYFFQHPRKLWQNEWYSRRVGFRIAKDRLETWQMWEMRVARAMGTPLLVAVLGEPDTPAGDIEGLIDIGLGQPDVGRDWFKDVPFNDLYLLRKAQFSEDIKSSLLPALARIGPNPRTAKNRALRRRYRFARILSPVAVCFLPLLFILLLLFLLVGDIAVLFRGAFEWVWKTLTKTRNR